MSTMAEAWWWLGIVVLFIVIIPVVLLLAVRIVSHLTEIRGYAGDVLEHGVAVTGNLDPVPALVETRDLVKDAGTGLIAYAGHVQRLL